MGSVETQLYGEVATSVYIYYPRLSGY